MARLEPWTAGEVVGRFREAGDTVRRLPRVRGPAVHVSGWPAFVQDPRDAYGYTEATLRLPAPSPRAIDRTDEVFSWFRFFGGDVEVMRSVWLCAGHGLSFAKAARKLGTSKTIVGARATAGVECIVASLNEQSTKQLKR